MTLTGAAAHPGAGMEEAATNSPNWADLGMVMDLELLSLFKEAWQP